MVRSAFCLALMLAFAGSAGAAEEPAAPAAPESEAPAQGRVIKIEIIGEKAVMPTSGDGVAPTRRIAPHERIQRQRELQQRRWRRPEASDVRRGQP